MDPTNSKQDNTLHALDSIEHQLYDPKAKVGGTAIHHVKSHRSLNLPASWGDDSAVIIKKPILEEEKGLTFGIKLLLVSTILLFVALAFSAWRVMSLRNVVSSTNIDMTADVTPYIEGGEATPLILTLRNRNKAVLEDASVTLLYKQGSGSQDEQEKVQEKRSLGTVNSGEFKKQDFSVSLYGSEGETRDIVLKLEYKVAGSNATFSKLVTSQVVLRTPPISVAIEGPSTLSIGQSGTYSFIIKNNSATTTLPSILALTLPNSFTVDGADPKPISRTNSWTIKPLLKGESQTVTVVGSFDGKDGETATFQGKIGSQGDSPSTIGIVYASKTSDVVLRSSPLVLAMNLSTSNPTGEALHYGDKAVLMVSYNNAGNQALQDVSIKLSLAGDAAIYNLVDPTSGYYDSVKKTITWDKATFPDLAVLAPNSQGMLQVIIPIVAKGNNSPSLKAMFVGSASSASQEDVVATVSKTYIVQGSATLEVRTQYKSSSFQNSGPIPPRPNQDTTYTALLKVSAQNALTDTKVSFTLPAYVTWRGVTSDTNAVSYNAKTRTVTWAPGAIAQGKTAGVEIGLSVRPSQSHINATPAITSGIILDADEEVSRAHLRTTLSPLTTALFNESWPQNPGMVVDR